MNIEGQFISRKESSYLRKLIRDLPSWMDTLFLCGIIRFGLDKNDGVVLIFEKETSPRLEREMEDFLCWWTRCNPLWAHGLSNSIIN